MWILERTKPTITRWVSHDNFVEFLQCHCPYKGSCKMLFACHFECSFLVWMPVWIMNSLVLCSTWGSYFQWWAHERESEHEHRALSAESNSPCGSCWPRRHCVWGGLYLWSHWEWTRGLFLTSLYIYLRLCLHSKWSLSVFHSVFLSREQARICGFLLYQEQQNQNSNIPHVSPFMEIIFSGLEKRFYHFSLKETTFKIRV